MPGACTQPHSQRQGQGLALSRHYLSILNVQKLNFDQIGHGHESRASTSVWLQGLPEWDTPTQAPHPRRRSTICPPNRTNQTPPNTAKLVWFVRVHKTASGYSALTYQPIHPLNYPAAVKPVDYRHPVELLTLFQQEDSHVVEPGVRFHRGCRRASLLREDWSAVESCVHCDYV